MNTVTNDLPPEYRITAKQLHTARQRLGSAEEGLKVATGKMAARLNKSEAGVLEVVRVELKRKRREYWRSKTKYLVLQVLASPRLLALTSLAAVLVDLLLFLVALIFLSTAGALLIAFIVGVLLSASLVIGRFGLNPSDTDLRAARTLWRTCCQAFENLEIQITVLERQAEYDLAFAEYERLRQIADSQRYKLLHTEWKSLRDSSFENFVGEVFELLGYRVEKTKRSGDQGIDLVVEGKRRRIGVQCKGYVSSVGNHAVQEAYAGQKFYGSDSCVVLTNSVFTLAAKELANKVPCKLIGEDQMIPLIMGEIF